jgi:saccharopine dehydrogenase-like NADP-dependent oxidoreductase
MQNILIIGAGRSSIYLIQYLISKSISKNWQIKIADVNIDAVKDKIGTSDFKNVEAVLLEIENTNERIALITWADVVISLMPPTFHDIIANDCLLHNKHLFTASYVSKYLQEINDKVAERGIFFMCEMGLDPGIDHVSALHCIDKIHTENGKIISFKSYCGGLVAPESDDNPWHYKISWNPRNVVLAGKNTAMYYKKNRINLIPYHRIFKDIAKLNIDGMGEWEGYANRNSLSYRQLYNLNYVPDFIRGTIRHKGFCESWNALVKLGFTDENCILHNCENLTFQEITCALLNVDNNENIELKCAEYLQEKIESNVMKNLRWLGVFSEDKLNKTDVSLADILQLLLEKKWKLSSDDKDMVILQHEFIFKQDKSIKKMISCLVDIGVDSKKTSMAKLVGLPLALCVEAFIDGDFGNITGVQIPTHKNIYPVMMRKLMENGIYFNETITDEI